MKMILFVLLIIFSVLLVIGLFKPWYVLWFVAIKNRIKVLIVFLPPLLILLLTYMSL